MPAKGLGEPGIASLGGLMYGPYADSIGPELPGGWIENDHARIDVAHVECKNPIRQFFSYYRSLDDRDLPRWSEFDICAVPPKVVSHIALGRPEYGAGDTDVPDHFVYTLQGGVIRVLTGRSLIGEPVGRVPGFTRKSCLSHEVSDAVLGRCVVCSRFVVETNEPSDLQLTRGLFPFSGDSRPIERLVVVVASPSSVH